MPKDKRPVLTVPQHALLRRAAEFAGHAGTPGRVEPLAMQFLATVTVQHANPHGVLKSLRDDGWIRMDGDAYAFDPGDFPVRTEHLRGARPRSIPENGLRHAARHWKAGERSLSERHLIASPEGYVEDAPRAAEGTTASAKRGDRLVASSAPPEKGAGRKKAAPAAPAARAAPRLSMTVEGIDTILFRHALQEDEAGGPLTLHASGEIFRGQVSDTQGYAARMKLKEDGLYEPVHADESTVLWRVTAVGRARVAARLAAHRAPPAPTHIPATDQPAPEHTIVKEQKQMRSDNITHAPTTWPERPVEAGGTREAYPKKKLPGVVIDDVDKAIIDAIIGRPDEQALRVQVMRVRRLSPGQVDGWRATRTKERNGSPPPAPNPAAPAEVPPVPEPERPPIVLSDAAWRGMRVIESCAAALPDGRFTARDLQPCLDEAGIQTSSSALLSDLRHKGLVTVVDKTSGGKGRPANVHTLTGRAYEGEDPEPEAPTERPVPASEPAPVETPAPVAKESPLPPPAARAPKDGRHGTLIPEERVELDALLEERAKLDRFEERDRAKLDEIATRRRVRKAKRNGLDARIAELRAKGGIT